MLQKLNGRSFTMLDLTSDISPCELWSWGIRWRFHDFERSSISSTSEIVDRWGTHEKDTSIEMQQLEASMNPYA
ncbi:hypothetical protein SDJN02_09055, partial [Cucurbita argyrosperma subsp. argyrosperma]